MFTLLSCFWVGSSMCLLSVCMARYPDISIVSGLLSVCMARYPDISIVPAHNKQTSGVSETKTEQFIKLEICFQ